MVVEIESEVPGLVFAEYVGQLVDSTAKTHSKGFERIRQGRYQSRETVIILWVSD